MRFANSPSVMSKVTVPSTTGRNSASLSQVYGSVAARVSVRNARGMTLVEVMIVVVIVGILSALGIYGVQKYLRSAQASEAYAVINAIRGAQEVYRQDTFEYLDVSGGNFDNSHPSAEPGVKQSWGVAAGASDDSAGRRFQQLGVDVDSGVHFRYSCVAGRTGSSFPSVPTQKKDFGLPGTASEPFYIIVAKGDLDGDGVYSYALSHSLTDEVYAEREGE